MDVNSKMTKFPRVLHLSSGLSMDCSTNDINISGIIALNQSGDHNILNSKLNSSDEKTCVKSDSSGSYHSCNDSQVRNSVDSGFPNVTADQEISLEQTVSPLSRSTFFKRPDITRGTKRKRILNNFLVSKDVSMQSSTGLTQEISLINISANTPKRVNILSSPPFNDVSEMFPQAKAVTPLRSVLKTRPSIEDDPNDGVCVTPVSSNAKTAVVKTTRFDLPMSSEQMPFSHNDVDRIHFPLVSKIIEFCKIVNFSSCHFHSLPSPLPLPPLVLQFIPFLLTSLDLFLFS